MTSAARRPGLQDLGARTLVMGVLNVTPDSFSDGGRFAKVEDAVRAGVALRAAGADIIDIGGESTRPGAASVSVEEELRRVLPVIEALRAAGVSGLSIDTTKAEVARRAVRAGAEIVNDISGLVFEPDLAEVVAGSSASLILGHTRGRPATMQAGEIVYPEGVVAAVKTALRRALEGARAAGVPAKRLLVDPGFGFGKTLEHNLTLLRGLGALAELGAPVVVGTSRKRFLGTLTGRPVDARVHATGATVALAVAGGAAVVRVHDVPEMLDVVRVADAVIRGLD
jgi:dihydropteroate synthase